MDLGKKRLFLLDLDGTVYLEETLLPGAAAFSNLPMGAYRSRNRRTPSKACSGVKPQKRI